MNLESLQSLFYRNKQKIQLVWSHNIYIPREKERKKSQNLIQKFDQHRVFIACMLFASPPRDDGPTHCLHCSSSRISYRIMTRHQLNCLEMLANIITSKYYLQSPRVRTVHHRPLLTPQPFPINHRLSIPSKEMGDAPFEKACVLCHPLDPPLHPSNSRVRRYGFQRISYRR